MIECETRFRPLWLLVFATTVLLAPEIVTAQTSTTQSDQNVRYPGAQPPSENVEATVGPLRVRLYGTLLMNISVSESNVAGQDIPLWAFPDSTLITFPDGTAKPAGDVHDTIFSARQSVLGFTLGQANPPSSGWSSSGSVEFDFFGASPVDASQPNARVLNEPRLRLAYFQLEKGMWRITAGQDNVILAPLDPISLSHVAAPLGATAGNLWGRLPQVRVDQTHKFGETTTVFQFGILRPEFSDPRLGDQPPAGTAADFSSSGLGARTSQPFYQTRIAISHPMQGSTMSLGAAGHYGREKVGAERSLDSWAFAFDLVIPVHSRLILRGEGFVGSNLIPFQGGILQGAAAVLPGRIKPIGSQGGWAELTILPTPDKKNIFSLGAGMDDPRDEDLLLGTSRAKNSFLWATYFRKVTEQVTLAMEWSTWQLRTITFVGVQPGPRGPDGSSNIVNLSLAYQF